MIDFLNDEDPDLAAQRKKQALQAALIDQQNMVDPNEPQANPIAAGAQPQPQPQQAQQMQAQQVQQLDPNGAVPDMSDGTPTPAPAPPANPSATGVGAPGNPNNEIQGWASQWLGRPFSQADLDALNGQPLDVVMHNIANSPEAQAFAARGQHSAAPAPPSSNTTGPTNGPLPVDTAGWINMLNSFRGNFPAPQLPHQLLTGNAADAQNQQIGLLQRVLANPDVYSEENVRQMQEAQKEQALALQKSTNTRLADQLAGMGRFGSGYQHAQERRTADTTMQQILSGNRDVSLGAASANNQAKLNALGTSQNLLGAQSQLALQQALGQAGLEQNANSQAIQAALGASGLSLNQFSAQNQNQQAWNSLMALLGMFNTTQTNNAQNAQTQ